jgi:L-ascorbate metabolism protein UlaG (beta-lactamase superfamily)
MKITRRFGFRILGRLVLLTLLGVTVLFGYALTDSWRATGTRAKGERLARLVSSGRFVGQRFQDVLPRHEGSVLQMSREYFFGGSAHRTPSGALPVISRTAMDFADQPARAGLRITWLGHSTILLELDGRRVLIDPVWSERASPFTWAGPRRFYPPPLPINQLPALDAVLISHDHYDHLDVETIVALGQATRAPFLVPLGVGAHLEYWGIPADRIIELDWWQKHALGGLSLVATPARHFSGRSITFSDRDATLWAGWALIGPEHRVFYSGDTAMFPGFSEIGARLGPFDATLIEAGAYNALWADVHLGPEQAVDAHLKVRGRLMIPVHWGLFDLALHGWTEPVERVLTAARLRGVEVQTPLPGGTVVVGAARPAAERWWPDVPWVSAEAAPVVSSGLVLSAAPNAVSRSRLAQRAP